MYSFLLLNSSGSLFISVCVYFNLSFFFVFLRYKESWVKLLAKVPIYSRYLISASLYVSLFPFSSVTIPLYKTITPNSSPFFQSISFTLTPTSSPGSCPTIFSLFYTSQVLFHSISTSSITFSHLPPPTSFPTRLDPLQLVSLFTSLPNSLSHLFPHRAFFLPLSYTSRDSRHRPVRPWWAVRVPLSPPLTGSLSLFHAGGSLCSGHLHCVARGLGCDTTLSHGRVSDQRRAPEEQDGKHARWGRTRARGGRPAEDVGKKGRGGREEGEGFGRVEGEGVMEGGENGRVTEEK